MPPKGGGLYKGRYINRPDKSRRAYWMIRCPCHPNADSKGYVKEHRLVVETFMGRFLSRDEVVHHIDGDGLNNAIENLELSTNSAHVKTHQFWETSPAMGKGRDKWKNFGFCKRNDCQKQATANGYCGNHNRDIWRQKRRELGLVYT